MQEAGTGMVQRQQPGLAQAPPAAAGYPSLALPVLCVRGYQAVQQSTYAGAESVVVCREEVGVAGAARVVAPHVTERTVCAGRMSVIFIGILKTARGLPAAAHVSAKARRSSSTKTVRSSLCPSGGTPPML